MPRYARLVAAVAAALLLGNARGAFALEKLCDPAFEDCRAPLITLIRNETVRIDVAFWFMEDSRYSTEIIKRWQAGVPVRVLVDTEANAGTPTNATILQQLKNAGIPMRERTGGGILHWKIMLFAGQNTVEFSGANYSAEAFVPTTAYSDYVDEVIYFTDRSSIVDSFKTRYDDQWANTTDYSDYANVSSRARVYPTFPIDPEMNFVPWENFATRSVNRYNAETSRIDTIMYRITDRRHTDALLAARARGIPIRLISEPLQYRDVTRLWDSWNIDRLYMAGVQVRMRKHAGLSHEKLTLLYGQGMTIFGSSNWTTPSAEYQAEHNIFTTDQAFFSWSQAHFDRKWNNTAPGGIQETEAFVPLPPDAPVLKSPSSGATGQGTSVTLTWYAGPWAHKYDVYIGTSTTAMTPVLVDRELGPSQASNDYKSWTVSGLSTGTTYYWKIVGRTMANVSKSSGTFSFTTAGTPPAGGGGGTVGGSLPSGWSSVDVGSTGASGHASASSGTYTVSGAGADIWGTSDQFQFAYEQLTGDGSITARVASVQNVSSWTKAGVMVRSSLSSSASHALMLVSAAKGLAFQRRPSSGGSSLNTAGAFTGAPYWVRIVRSGNTFSAYQSSNGSSWSFVGSESISMGATIYVGLAVSSHVTGTVATATFDNVSVSGSSGGGSTSSLPSGWSTADIGSVSPAGSANASGGTFTVRGAGADVWGTADAFRFAYQTVSGDATITARVTGVQNVDAWSKGGVMMRASASAGSAHAFMLVSAGKGLAFQRRPTTGGTSLNTYGAASTGPYWVRVQRRGSTFTAYQSSDGSHWTVVGSQTISMPSSILVGLGVTSHANGSLATVTFDSVSVGP